VFHLITGAPAAAVAICFAIGTDVYDGYFGADCVFR